MFKRPTPPDIETDWIIIGAGVTGITIAEIFHESNIDFWLLGSPFDSQLAKAGILEETSLPEGTVGLKYIEKRFEELKEREINHRSSQCTGIEVNRDKYSVMTKFQNFTAQKVIIATGSKQKSLGFEGEEELFHKGISDCTVCDFPLYREKPVAIIGNHKYTIRAAKLMKKHTSPVTLLWYNSDDAPELDGITVYNQVSDIVAKGNEVLEKVSFDSEGQNIEIQISGLFVEGQPEPASGFLGEFNLELENGFIKINEDFETNRPNIFAVGDVTGQTDNFDDASKVASEFANNIVAGD